MLYKIICKDKIELILTIDFNFFFRVGVRLGEYDVSTESDCDKMTGICAPPVQDFYIEDIVAHPEYNKKTFINDIALVRLATSANLTYGK